MIRRTPCERYLKFLLVHPKGYSDADVKLILRQHQLDYHGAREVEHLRESLQSRIPRPFRPWNKRDSAAFQFLVKEGIYYLFHPDETMHAAVNLIFKARAKEALEAMAIAKDSPYSIAFHLSSLGYKVDEKIVKRYLDFFWNIELVDSGELQTLLHMRYEVMATDGDDLETAARHRAMKRASYNDPRMVALNSSSPALASLLVQYKMGKKPGDMNLADLLDTVRTIMMLRSADAGLTRGEFASRQATDFSTAAKNLNELITAIGAPEKTLQNDLVSSLTLETDKREVPYIHQLTNGSHTVDVQPTSEPVRE